MTAHEANITNLRRRQAKATRSRLISIIITILLGIILFVMSTWTSQDIKDSDTRKAAEVEILSSLVGGLIVGALFLVIQLDHEESIRLEREIEKLRAELKEANNPQSDD